MRRPQNASRGAKLLDLMGQILGEPVKLKSRESRYVWARAMVAYQMIQEGYSTFEVGKVLDKDHSSVIYLRNRMSDALAYEYAYQDIVDIWKRYQTLIKDDLHGRTTQDLISLGGEFPDCDKSEMGEESGEIRNPADL
jgi:hypothetical protein